MCTSKITSFVISCAQQYILEKYEIWCYVYKELQADFSSFENEALCMLDWKLISYICKVL